MWTMMLLAVWRMSHGQQVSWMRDASTSCRQQGFLITLMAAASFLNRKHLHGRAYVHSLTLFWLVFHYTKLTCVSLPSVSLCHRITGKQFDSTHVMHLFHLWTLISTSFSSNSRQPRSSPSKIISVLHSRDLTEAIYQEGEAKLREWIPQASFFARSDIYGMMIDWLTSVFCIEVFLNYKSYSPLMFNRDTGLYRGSHLGNSYRSRSSYFFLYRQCRSRRGGTLAAWSLWSRWKGLQCDNGGERDLKSRTFDKHCSHVQLFVGLPNPNTSIVYIAWRYDIVRKVR